MELMNFTADDRGVSPVIGAILVFGLVITSVALIQANAIPLEVQQTEYDHNQLAQEQLLALSEDIEDSAARDTVGAETVVLGTRHAAGFPFVKPGPSSGELRTEPSDVVLRNVLAANDREADDYWAGAGNERTIPTSRILYSPDYAQYGNAPVTVIGPEGTYNRFPKERAVSMLGGGIVNGDVINLVAVESGSLSVSRAGPAAFETYPVTGRMRSLSVESEGATPIEIDVQSDLTLEEAQQLFRDEPSVTVSKPDADTVRLTLAAGTYELRLGKVGFNAAGTPEPARYVTSETLNGTKIFPGGTKEVTFRVFDGFNTPVENEMVNLTITSTSTVTFLDSGTQNLTARTDAEGRVSVVVGADPTSAEVNATVYADLGTNNPISSPEAAATQLAVRFITGGGSGGSGAEDGVSAINPGVDSDSVTLVGVADNGSRALDLTFDNEIGSQFQLTEARVSFYFDSSSGQQIPATAELFYPTDASTGITINVGNEFIDVRSLNFVLSADTLSGDVDTLKMEFPSNIGQGDFIILSTRWDQVNGDGKITVSYFINSET